MNISLELSNYLKGGRNSDLDSMRDQVYNELFLPSDTTLYFEGNTNPATEIIRWYMFFSTRSRYWFIICYHYFIFFFLLCALQGYLGKFHLTKRLSTSWSSLSASAFFPPCLVSIWTPVYVFLKRSPWGRMEDRKMLGDLFRFSGWLMISQHCHCPCPVEWLPVTPACCPSTWLLM